MDFNHRITLFLAFVLVLLIFLFFAFSSGGLLKVYFLDVGQGDAIFVETPDKFQFLLDGGPDNVVLSELSEFMPFYDRSIDLIIISHPQKDHIMGLVEVLKRYSIGSILFYDVSYKNEAYFEIKKIAKQKNINMISVKAGDRVNLGDFAFLDVLYPFDFNDEIDNVNDLSLAFILNFLDKKFFFSGDAEKKEELDLVNLGVDLKVDVLKINHHGSRSSSLELFLEKVNPEIAVISVGEDNKYNHPSDMVLSRLKGVDVLRTDKMGRIKIFTDGVFLKYETEK